jgi:hypothetical protein
MIWRSGVFRGRQTFWQWKLGLETFCNNIRERQVSKLRNFTKLGSHISVLNRIRTAVNMERTRPRNGMEDDRWPKTLILPKRKSKEDQELNRVRKFVMQWRRKDWMKYGGNGGHAVAQWLRHCATNWKAAGSIPDGINWNFSLT